MTSKNKEILWYIAGATIVVLVALYLFVPPVHSWVNSVIGREEKSFPKPNSGDDVEYEYGTPVEDIEGERIDVPRDSLLDSLLMADTTLVGVVRPVDGPAPAHVEGFGEGPLPPAPSEDNLPNKNELSPEEQAQLENIAPSVEDIWILSATPAPILQSIRRLPSADWRSTSSFRLIASIRPSHRQNLKPKAQSRKKLCLNPSHN